MKRDIYPQLLAWKGSARRKPLILRGARQTGKTYILQKFGEKEFDDVKLLLYFTDLDGRFPVEVPTYDVKWVSPNDKDVPFGEVIVLEK